MIAAGGIADGRGLAAVLALGAQAGWVGTRFLLAEEARIHPEWRRLLREASETSSVVASVFDGGWPGDGSRHRVLRNSTVTAWERAGRPRAPDRPGEGEPLGEAPNGRTIHRYDAEPPHARTTGEVEAMVLYAGQSVGLVGEVTPAAAIVEELVAGAVAALRR